MAEALYGACLVCTSNVCPFVCFVLDEMQETDDIHDRRSAVSDEEEP